MEIVVTVRRLLCVDVSKQGCSLLFHSAWLRKWAGSTTAIGISLSSEGVDVKVLIPTPS